MSGWMAGLNDDECDRVRQTSGSRCHSQPLLCFRLWTPVLKGSLCLERIGLGGGAGRDKLSVIGGCVEWNKDLLHNYPSPTY